jgi:glucose-6-phosphate 1-epimerase
VFSLNGPAPTPEYLPGNFEISYHLEISTKLGVLLKYVNFSTDAQTITEALHTYLTVKDVRNVSITGLSGVTFIDKVKQHRIPEGNAPIAITAETDRVYLNTISPVEVSDPGMKRRIRVSKSGSNSTVVWNPWIDKSKKMPDFGDDEWPGMLCIETANAHDNRVTVAPNSTHEIGTSIEVLPL